MKKLLTACAVAGLSAAVFGDVTSANVVGYNTKSDVSTWKAANNRAFTLMGLPFEGIGKGVSLNDLVISGAVCARSAAPSSGVQPDQIWLWADIGGGVYDYQKFFLKGNPTTQVASGWFLNANAGTSFDTIYDQGLPAGTGFWFSRHNPDGAITVTTDGEVGGADAEWTILKGQFQFVTCPFPINLKLNDATVFDSAACICARSAAPSSGVQPDQIWLWVDQGNGTWDYQKFFYKGNPTTQAASGWYLNANAGVSFDSLYSNGVPVGAGFWFKASADHAEDFKVTFKSPVAKPAVD